MNARQMAELWNAIRVPVAFLVAPLGAPIVMALIFGLHLLASILFDAGAATDAVLGLFLFTMIPTLAAYPIMFVIGVPLYRILIKKEVTEFWIAPAAGGGIAFACLLLVFPTAGRQATVFVFYVTLSGAATGAIFWLIARPDRQTSPESSAHDEPVSP